jgi:hypothetical protein
MKPARGIWLKLPEQIVTFLLHAAGYQEEILQTKVRVGDWLRLAPVASEACMFFWQLLTAFPPTRRDHNLGAGTLVDGRRRRRTRGAPTAPHRQSGRAGRNAASGRNVGQVRANGAATVLHRRLSWVVLTKQANGKRPILEDRSANEQRDGSPGNPARPQCTQRQTKWPCRQRTSETVLDRSR